MGRKSSYDAAYKAKVAIEAIKEQKTISEIAVEYKVSPSLISAWKAEFLENASQAFMKTGNQSRETDKLKHENEKLLKKVGQLTLEVDFFCAEISTGNFSHARRVEY